MPTTEEIIASLNDAEKETGSLDQGGGGALFAKVTTAWGYKVFASGTTHEDSFFPTPFPPKGDASKAALEAAKAYKTSVGANGNPAFSWVMSIKPTDVLGESKTWKGSQHKVSVRWKRKDKDGNTKSVLDDVVLPELVTLNMLTPGTYYIRIKYIRNPITPGTDADPDILWIPAEVFKTEALCREAAVAFFANKDAGVSGASTEDLPPDWDAKTWNQFKEQIVTSLKNKEKPAAVAATWGIPVPWMVKFAASVK